MWSTVIPLLPQRGSGKSVPDISSVVGAVVGGCDRLGCGRGVGSEVMSDARQRRCRGAGSRSHRGPVVWSRSVARAAMSMPRPGSPASTALLRSTPRISAASVRVILSVWSLGLLQSVNSIQEGGHRLANASRKAWCSRWCSTWCRGRCSGWSIRTKDLIVVGHSEAGGASRERVGLVRWRQALQMVGSWRCSFGRRCRICWRVISSLVSCGLLRWSPRSRSGSMVWLSRSSLWCLPTLTVSPSGAAACVCRRRGHSVMACSSCGSTLVGLRDASRTTSRQLAGSCC